MRDGELIKELRHERGVHDYDLRPLCRRAADALSRLEAENARLREALEPFATVGRMIDDPINACCKSPDGNMFTLQFIWPEKADSSRMRTLTLGDFRRAGAALSPPPPEPAR